MRLIDADRFKNKECVELATEVIKSFLEYIDEQPTVIEKQEQKEHRWIPASERLPKDFEAVLVWFEFFRYGEFNRLYQTIGISYVLDGK